MAAAAHLRSPITSNSTASNACQIPTSGPSLSRRRLPTAREPRVASCQRRQILALTGEEGDGVGATRQPAPRFLCLHGFRTSGEIMRRQVSERWPADVTSRLDLAFADAPFPAEGESPVRGVFALPRRGRVPGERRLRPALLRVVPVRRRGFPQVQEFRRVLGQHRGADGQRRAVRRIVRFLSGRPTQQRLLGSRSKGWP